MRLDREADRVAGAEVEPAHLHQVAVDDGVEEIVVDDVVDVVIDIVIAPARGDAQLVLVAFAAFAFWVHIARQPKAFAQEFGRLLSGEPKGRPGISCHEAWGFF